MSTFFRSMSDGYVFPMFGWLHWSILGILLVGYFYIFWNVRKNPKQLFRFHQVLLGLILLEQVLLYPWYYFALGFDPRVSLPMYSCRLAMLLYLFGDFFDNRALRYFAAYFGFPGGLVALFFPVLDNYSFPHLTNFTYFIGHLSLSWISVIFLLSDRSQKSYIKESLLFTHLYLVITYMVDLRYDTNYAYLMESPIFTEFFKGFSHPVYLGIIYLVYISALLMVHWGFQSLKSHYQRTASE